MGLAERRADLDQPGRHLRPVPDVAVDDPWQLTDQHPWPTDEAGEPLVPPPVRVGLASTHARVDDLAPPASPFTRHLTDEEADRRFPPGALCLRSGPLQVGPSGLLHMNVPCHHLACVRCAPRRLERALDTIATRAAECDVLWVYRIDADDVSELDGHRERIVKKVRKSAGDYLWLRVPTASGQVALVVLSSVDHSVRPYRGSVARRCDSLALGDALAYLHRLLWHGAYTRRVSRGWKIGEERQPMPGDAAKRQLTSVGMTRGSDLPAVEREARKVFEAWRSTGRTRVRWSPADDVPRLPLADLGELFTLARQRAIDSERGEFLHRENYWRNSPLSPQPPL